MSSNALLPPSANDTVLVLKKTYLRVSLIFLVVILGGFSALAQTDSLTVSKKSVELQEHSPHKATLLALVPGLGQIYNRKYWKLPIVYAGFGVTGYFAMTNRTEYKKYREAYNCSVTLESECTNELAIKYSADDLQTIRDYYRRNMELSYIIMGAWYVLQMLDATVDAHLYNWEVNDNLSVRVDPIIQPIQLAQPNSALPSSVTPNGLRIMVSF